MNQEDLFVPASRRYPQINKAAEEMAREIFQKINSKVSRINEPTTPYKAQSLLELLIEKLQKVV